MSGLGMGARKESGASSAGVRGGATVGTIIHKHALMTARYNAWCIQMHVRMTGTADELDTSQICRYRIVAAVVVSVVLGGGACGDCDGGGGDGGLVVVTYGAP
jgi:hypothetical protein